MDKVGWFFDQYVSVKVILAALGGYFLKWASDRRNHTYAAKRNAEQDERRYKNALRMAALDKRLEVYAEAFSLLMDCRSQSFTETKHEEARKKLWNFLKSNTVYLDKKTVLEVRGALAGFECALQREQNSQANLKDLWSSVHDALDAVLEFTSLPPLKDKPPSVASQQKST
ncbi:hypothetical protein [Microbulbifer discodermiae]|uniref:hypothetical protein n=1 Tax=Microbulbifer sp. 2201CG32-9 TaxID=3232309 RepID=UPI00345BD00E